MSDKVCCGIKPESCPDEKDNATVCGFRSLFGPETAVYVVLRETRGVEYVPIHQSRTRALDTALMSDPDVLEYRRFFNGIPPESPSRVPLDAS